METGKRFKVQQCAAVEVVTKQFKRSSIPALFISLPMRSLFLFTVICFALLMPSIAHAVGAVQLPQTGQTTCYDVSGNVINCAGTGQDGEMQAGTAWPNPRFTAGTGAETDCMIDNFTGLMWPKNGNLPNGSKPWNDAIDYSNNLTLCGHSDWRLPNINELESLVNADVSSNNAWLNAQGFTSVQSFGYWSSTTRAYDTVDAWYVYMWNGRMDWSYKANYGVYVWPVRSGQSGSFGNSVIWRTGQIISYRSGDDGDLQLGVSWPSPRFTDRGNGEVTDNLTDIVWTKDTNAPGPSACSPGATKAWQEALDYVKCLNTQNYLGHNDWRLPNRMELFSLADISKYSPALPSGHPFTNLYYVQSSPYWSSTTGAGSTGNAWLFDMYWGSVGWGSKSINGYVWPVRSGLSGSPVDSFNLVITKSGTGSGTVTSDPAGIICGNDCSENYSLSIPVTLTAAAASGSTFTGWSGSGCSGAASCHVTMDASKNVTATFTLEASPQYSISGVVKDIANSKVIPGVTIKVKDVSSGTTVTTTTTDGSGNYTAIIPLKGEYVMSANKTGYEDYAQMEPPFALTDTSPNATLNIYIFLLDSDALIPLRQGWNFISLPKQPPNTAIGEVLKEISPNVRIIWTHDNDTKNWLEYKTDQIHTFDTMGPGKGYWLYVEVSGNITMTGWGPPSSTQVHLFDGWNLLGYLGADGKDIAAALTSISTKWSIIWGWDNGIWSAKHETMTTFPQPIQPLTILNQGKAYWIKIKPGQTADWNQ